MGEKHGRQYLLNRIEAVALEKPALLSRFIDLVSRSLTHTGKATRFALLRSSNAAAP